MSDCKIDPFALILCITLGSCMGNDCSKNSHLSKQDIKNSIIEAFQEINAEKLTPPKEVE